MLTELDVVNEMLASAGLAPVASLDTQHPAVKQAQLRLQATSIKIQQTGAWYNRSFLTLQPDVSGVIIVPQYAVYVNPTERDGRGITIRGRRLYDLDNRTYNIGKPLHCEVIEVLPFEEVPIPAREYIKAVSVHEFYLSKGGQEPKLSEYRGLRQVAEIEYKKEHLKNMETRGGTIRRYGPRNVNRHDQWN